MILYIANGDITISARIEMVYILMRILQHSFLTSYLENEISHGGNCFHPAITYMTENDRTPPT